MSETTKTNNPKSIRHKRILDIAADEPDATLEDIARQIPSVTPDLVERVLEQYGDPAEDTTEDPLDSEHTGDSAPYPAPTDLTTKQRAALRAVHDQPEATQREIANELDVSPATVSNRVHSIDGFDWTTRANFSRHVFGTPPGRTDGDIEDETLPEDAGNETVPEDTEDETVPEDAGNETPDEDSTKDSQREMADAMTTDNTELTERLEALTDRLSTVEDRLDARTDGATRSFTDPELTHKIMHACMESETITEDEELRILRELLE